MEGIKVISIGGLESNVYVIDDLMVDTTSGRRAAVLEEALKKKGVEPASIKRIVNTHLHYDHIGGNALFPNAEVFMHEDDARLLERLPEATYYREMGGDVPAVPENTLKEGDKIRAGKYLFKVIHTPGHSPGSICLYDDHYGVLITGDTVFCDGVGRTDLIGGSWQALVESIEKIAQLDVSVILPGHGPVCTDAEKVFKKIGEMIGL